MSAEENESGQFESEQFIVTECKWYIPELPPAMIALAELTGNWLNNAIRLRADESELASFLESLVALKQHGPDVALKLLPARDRAEVATLRQIYLQNTMTGIMPGTMRGMN